MSDLAFHVPTANDSLLVVIDVQGRLARLMHESEAMIGRQRILIEACRILELPVLLTEQVPDKLGSTVDELASALDGIEPQVKTAFGCLGDPGIRQTLEACGRRSVLIAGIEAHVCVWQTARALRVAGYEVHVVADAVSSRSAFNRDIAFRRMEAIGVRLSSVEMVLFELMVDAKHDQFRAVTRLLR